MLDYSSERVNFLSNFAIVAAVRVNIVPTQPHPIPEAFIAWFILVGLWTWILPQALFCQSNCLKRFHQLIDVRAPEGEQETPVVVAEPAMEAGEGQGDKGGEQASAHVSTINITIYILIVVIHSNTQ